jgi:ABC-type nickel/cobalt efflux system permease component RcnA
VTAAGGTITMLVGAVVLRLTVTDTYRRYVQPGMGKWLLIAGVLVIAIGAFTLVQSLRNADLEEGHGHDHEDSHRSRPCYSSRRRPSAPTGSIARRV